METLKPHHIFDAIPEDLSDEVFQSLVQSNSIKIERIISKGHASPDSGWYDLAGDEWVILLKGEAILAFQAKDEVHLKAGDHIHIPAHTRHRVKWTTADTETIWVAVHY